MSIQYGFIAAGLPVVDLPRCSCGGDFVQFSVDAEVEGQQLLLVGHVVCGDCGLEPEFTDSGSDASDWHDAVLRCVNAWSLARGGIEYPRLVALPDRLDDLVAYVEGQLGPLPEFRARVLARHAGRRLQ